MTVGAVSRRQIMLLDTSVLLELLGTPHESDHQEKAEEEYELLISEGVELRIPMATVLETGSHVGKIDNGYNRRECAKKFDKFMRAALGAQAPWKFTPLEWDDQLVLDMLNGYYPDVTMEVALSTRVLEMGDMAIIQEFRRLRANLDSRVVDVDVWTYDSGLRSAIDVLRSKTSS